MNARRILLSVAVLASSLAVGCGGNGDAPESSSEPIKIGASLPLTGEFSEPGEEANRGYQVWERDINARGGLLGRPVEMVIRDDASREGIIVADYNALIHQENVDLLLGTFSSRLNLPASSVAERNRMLFIEPAGTSPELFERGYRYLFLSQPTTAEHYGDIFVDYILSLPESRRPETAAYPSLDDPFALANVTGVREQLEAEGIETVYDDSYPIDTTNFVPIANALKAAEPDIVAQGEEFAFGVGLIRALEQVGFDPPYMYQTNAPTLGEQFLEAVGEENAQGIFYAIGYSPEVDTEGNETLMSGYEEMFGTRQVTEDAADGYAAGQVLEAAVTAVGSVEDQEALADWLRENEVETVLGPLDWDDAGRPQSTFMLGQWQDGRAVIVLPEDRRTSETIVGPEGSG